MMRRRAYCDNPIKTCNYLSSNNECAAPFTQCGMIRLEVLAIDAVKEEVDCE